MQLVDDLGRRRESDGSADLHALVDGLTARGVSLGLSGESAASLSAAIDSFLHWANLEFNAAHDDFRLVGEDNFRRYLPTSNLRIRIHAEDSPTDVFIRAAAACAAGGRAVVSSPPALAGVAKQAVLALDDLTDCWAGSIEFVEETDEELAAAMASRRVARVRYAAAERVPEIVRRAAAESLVYVADATPVGHGRVELLWYVQEQSLSRVYHRYGNLGRRADEERAEVL